MLLNPASTGQLTFGITNALKPWASIYSTRNLRYHKCPLTHEHLRNTEPQASQMLLNPQAFGLPLSRDPVTFSWHTTPLPTHWPSAVFRTCKIHRSPGPLLFCLSVQTCHDLMPHAPWAVPATFLVLTCLDGPCTLPHWQPILSDCPFFLDSSPLSIQDVLMATVNIFVYLTKYKPHYRGKSLLCS